MPPDDTAPPLVEFRILGPFSVYRAGTPLRTMLTGPAQHLLIYLLLHPGQRHRREWLMEQIWQNTPVTRSAFNTALWRIRRFLKPAEGAALEVGGDTLRLVLDSGTVVVDATALLTEADAIVAQPDGSGIALERLERAVNRWRGPCADGLSQDWALVARERLHTAYLQALGALLRAAAADSKFELALAYGRQILTEDPFREAVHCEVIWLQALTGQRAHAIRSHIAYRALLKRELDIAPMAETEALYTYIRDGLEAAPPDLTDFTGSSATAGREAAEGRPARRYHTYLDAIDRSRSHLFHALKLAHPTI